MKHFRQRFHPAFVVWLAIMWVLLEGQLSWANVLGGLAVGLLVVIALPLPGVPTGGIKVRWDLLIGYVFVWFGQLIAASCTVAWLAIRPDAPPKTSVIVAPLRVHSELVFALAVAAYNLQPGGSIADIDLANRRVTIHLLDAGDDAAVAKERAAVAQLERRMLRIFEGVK